LNIIAFLVSFALLIAAMSVHEFFHGWTAYKLGDNTAKNSGRLTLNPLAHIDPVGTIIVPLFLFIATSGQFVFGSAKPVPINYWALKNPRRDMVLIGASGPLANLAFALLLSVLLRFIPLSGLVSFLLRTLISVNVVLGIFNLLPIPPLDGSRILAGVLPKDLSWRYSALEPYGFIILIFLIWIGILDSLVWPVVRLILGVLI